MPEFTEREIDLCLEQAACLRGSYGQRAEDGRPIYAGDEVAEAVEWDALARKLNEFVRLMAFERKCGAGCVHGTGRVSGKPCLACAGTGVLPPRVKVEG